MPPKKGKGHAQGPSPGMDGYAQMMSQPSLLRSGRPLDALDELARVSGMSHASMALHVGSRAASRPAAAAAQEKAKASARLAKLGGE